ncbi:MAG: ATP-grasp domain-containing protein, partial [Desulfobacteraceae bacterium]|nr:ATP-grasp domain-containing protein [Desulfobacteraceae bacterium]
TTSSGFIRAIEEIGTPVLIKASTGGGGKGMHIVENITDLEQAVQLAKGEAKRAFGNDQVYAERYVKKSRHIEVQVMADHHGNVIHLGERECSIQRRFQKIIEESPAPALSSELREKICKTAVEITRKADYRNAGTVEFILAPDDQFYFLEMNTRLQVEHPVTEMVTGQDLVEMQIRIARGEKLSLTQDQVTTDGHAIELRLYAEDPENDFLPATGSLLAYQMPKDPAVRVENGFSQGMTVSSAFDPMLAKLIVHGKNRDTAIENGVMALKETLVLGVTTNVDFLARILDHPAFAAAKIDTEFIPQHARDLKPPALSKKERDLFLAATALSNIDFINPSFTVPVPHALLGNWRN